ncbi:hypothetical protein P170DRAFT_432640 [Aspergillus steynii IBT 23096]|uniref:Uncharacterized protein n=1 Tax=Aspergillus steynii IBT 23096 TaxID=1392250 RepID=A0A2I2GQE8_9EURO|nr:uncharacterized protein P170DRAFT_432640 [Aspergillus steynii IBT 23096]PLB55099.1 hypothetical protein P170DRAFT_432640 [Aspergillus steynii IBT 23096]
MPPFGCSGLSSLLLLLSSPSSSFPTFFTKPFIANLTGIFYSSLTTSKLAQLQGDRFRFTPIKTTRDIPRVWDRQPSTPFLSRPRSRKVWKRFRSSFNSMKSLQRLIATGQECVKEDFYFTEINTSRNATSMRGVKRRCLSQDDSDETTSRGRSFLETQWESNLITGRRRKIPTKYGLVDESEPMTVETLQPEEAQGQNNEDEIASDTSTSVAQNSVEQDESRTAIALAPPLAYPRVLHGQSSAAPSETDETVANIKETADFDSPQINLPSSRLGDESDLPASIATATATAITTTEAEDATLDATMTVDRQSHSLEEHPSTDETVAADGTPPAAAAAPAPTTAPVQELTAEQESTLVRSALRSSLDGEDAALINNFLTKAKAKRDAKAAAPVTPEIEEGQTSPPLEIEVTEMPTPPSRRALEDLDTNSPSPQKSQPSPIKGFVNNVNKKDEQPPSSPRRSARNSTPKPSSRRTPGVIQNTLSLRRSNGTEFVFLQRSEAQELALATRRNTRKNKGESVPPKFTLQKLAQTSSDSDRVVTDNDESAHKPGRPAAGKKRVSWSEHLVEYEGEQNGGTRPGDDVGGRGDRSPSRRSEKGKANSRRVTRSQGSPESGGDGTSTTAPATATPRTRRVRRLGTSKSSATAAVASLESSPSSLSPSPEKRKKLTPRSPSTTLLGSSTSKVSSTSRSSGSGSTGKSASIFQTHAGSTPMPRRVRSARLVS